MDGVRSRQARPAAQRMETAPAAAARPAVASRGAPAAPVDATVAPAPAPAAGRPSAPEAVVARKALAFRGRLDEAIAIVGDAVHLPPAALMSAALRAAAGRGRELLTDVLVARAAELDPSSWKALSRAVREAPKTDVVATENLVEALTTLAPFLDARCRRALTTEAKSWRADAPSVRARVDVLTAWLGATNGEQRLPTRSLRSDAVLALTPAEKAEQRSVVPVDDERIVNAKIPADLKLRPAHQPFARDYYSKGWLGAGQPGVLVCDTGNALEPGVTDHHHLGVRTCAAALVLNNVELIVEHHKRAPIDKLVCHSTPDLDAVSSVFFAELILRDGRVPEGASRLAHYVSEEDNARQPVGNGDPRRHLATLCREAALRLAKERHPGDSNDANVQRRRDDEYRGVVTGILQYVLASGKDPRDESLFTRLSTVDPAILPPQTRADIEALQVLVTSSEDEAKALLTGVRFGQGRLPRIDGRGLLDVRFALTEQGGKRLDSMLRERHGADVVIISTPEYTWTGAEPTAGASLRPIAAAYEAVERQKARAAGNDRQPGPGEKLQPGWSTKNPYYIGGTDTFIITPREAQLTGEERLRVLEAAAGVTSWEAA